MLKRADNGASGVTLRLSAARSAALSLRGNAERLASTSRAEVTRKGTGAPAFSKPGLVLSRQGELQAPMRAPAREVGSCTDALNEYLRNNDRAVIAPSKIIPATAVQEKS